MMLAIEKLAIDLGRVLKKHNLTLATAESCTGGGLSYWITSVPGSSEWFDRGFITYNNDAKINMLSVPPAILNQHGPVSKQVACSMAEGALKNSRADIGIAITGIAGPEGGSALHPVGTIWVAIARKNAKTTSFVEVYQGNRQHIRTRVMEQALEKVMEIFPNSLL